MAKHTCVYCGKPFMAGGPTAENDLICPNCGSKNMAPLREAAAAQFASLKNPEPGDSPVAATANRLIDNIEKVIVGKRDEIVLTVMAYFAEGHVLLEDVPGVAKTMLARALAAERGLRVQAHPMHARPVAQRHHGQLRSLIRRRPSLNFARADLRANRAGG